LLLAWYMDPEPLPRELFDVLACPVCRSDLAYNRTKTALVCRKCKKEYGIREGIPVFV